MYTICFPSGTIVNAGDVAFFSRALSVLRRESGAKTLKRFETRIACASVGVFIWLGGLYATIRGLLYDESALFRYGMLALVVGVATFVIALNPLANRNSRK